MTFLEKNQRGKVFAGLMMTETVVNVQEAPNNANAKSGDQSLAWLKINLDYFKTLPGKLKIVELVWEFRIV